MPKVGDAWVDVRPSTRGFYIKLTDDVKKWAASQEGDGGLKIPVKPERDEKAWKAEQEKWQRDFDSSSKPLTQKVKLEPDTSRNAKNAYKRAVKAMHAEVADSVDTRVKVFVDADTSQARAKLSTLRDEKITVRVDVDRTKAEGALASAAMQQAMGDRKVYAQVEVDPASLIETRKMIDRTLQYGMQKDGRPNKPTVRVGVDTSQIVDAQSKLADFVATVKATDLGKVKLNLDIDGDTSVLDNLFDDSWEKDENGDRTKTVYVSPQLWADELDWSSLFDDRWSVDENGDHTRAVYITPELWLGDGDDNFRNQWQKQVEQHLADRKIKVKLDYEVADKDGLKGFNSELDKLDRRVAKGEREIKVKTTYTDEGNGAAVLKALASLPARKTVVVDFQIRGEEKLGMLVAAMQGLSNVTQVQADLREVTAPQDSTSVVTFKVVGEDDIDRVRGKLDTLAVNREVVVNVATNDADAEDRIANLTHDRDVVITPVVEIDEMTRRDIDESLRTAFTQVRVADVDVKVDGGAADAELDLIARERTAVIKPVVVGEEADYGLAHLARERQVKVELDAGPIEDAANQLDAAYDALTRFQKEWFEDLTARAEVWVEVDDAAAEAQLEHLTRDRVVRVTVDGTHIPAASDGGRDVFRRSDRPVHDLTAAARGVEDAVEDLAETVEDAAATVARRVEDAVDGAERSAARRDRDALDLQSTWIRAAVGALEHEQVDRYTSADRLADRIKTAVEFAGRKGGDREDYGWVLRDYTRSIAPRIEKGNEKVAQEVREVAKQVERLVTRPTLRDGRDGLDYGAIDAQIRAGRAYAGAGWEDAMLRRRLADVGEHLGKVSLRQERLLADHQVLWSRRFDRAADLFEQAAEREGAAAGGYRGNKIRPEHRGRADDVWQAQQVAELSTWRMRQARLGAGVEVDNAALSLTHAQIGALQRKADRLEGQINSPVARVVPVRVDNTDELDALIRSAQASLVEGATSAFGGPDDHRVRFNKLSRAARAERLMEWGDGWETAVGRPIRGNRRSGPVMTGLNALINGLVKVPGAGLKGAGMLMKGLAPTSSPVDFSGVATGGVKSLAEMGIQGTGNIIKPSQLQGMGMGKMPKIGHAAVISGIAKVAAMATKASLTMGALGGAVGIVTDSLAGFGAMAVSVLKPAAQSFKLIAGAPAGLAAVATGIATIALSVGGLGDAFSNMDDPEAWAESMAKLAPEAREFANAVRDVREPWRELRSEMQNSMFDGMAESFTAMTDNLMPVLQRQWPEMARVIGDVGDAVMDTFASPQVAARVERTFGYMTDGFRRMVPGAREASDVLSRMVEIGSREIMPALGDAFSNAAASFNDFMDEGRITRWIEAGKRGVSEFGGMVKDLAAGAGDFMGAMSKGADAAFGNGGVMGSLRKALSEFRDFASSDMGQMKIANFFEGATETARQVMDIAGQWGGALVNDVIPATREFLDKHGSTIGDLGEDILQISGKAVQTLGPLVESIAAVANTVNEITGGPGSEKARNRLGKDAREGLDNLSENWDREYANDEVRNKAVDGLRDYAGEKRRQLSENIGSVDTAEWQNLATVMEMANVKAAQLQGGFDQVRQSADATGSVMSLLGNKIVDIPDAKTIEIEADPNDVAVGALRKIGAQVEEIEGKPGQLRVEFQNEMDITGALANLRSEMQNLDPAEIEVRGLDTAFNQLAQLKAEMDGMSGEAELSINTADVDSVVAKLQEAGVAAQNINGSVYLDTNLPEVQSWLESIGAGSVINGQFVLESNAAEVIAEVLGIDATTVTALLNVDSNAAEVRGEVESLNGANTNSQHNVGTNAQEVHGQVDGLRGKNTASNHAIGHNAGAVASAIQSNAGKNTTSTHTIIIQQIGSFIKSIPGKVKGMFQENGSVIPAAEGFSQRQAMIAPKGSYILWAENETEGESYIPHALSKRKRSTQILAETANQFGLGLVDMKGNPVERDGSSVAPMAQGGVKHASPRSRELSELNRQRAHAEALKKVEQQKLEREEELRKKDTLTPAEVAESKSLESELEEIRQRRKEVEQGYARKLVDIRNGEFIYADASLDDDDLVRSVDYEGLIPTNIRVSDTIEDWSEIDPRSVGLIRAMDSNVFRDAYDARAGEMEAWALSQGLDPAQVAMARQAVDGAMPLTDLPEDVRHALLTGGEVSRKDRGHRDIDQRKLFQAKGSFEEYDWATMGQFIGGSYADEVGDALGLKVRMARDIPLYNLMNPDEDTWNTFLRDVRGGKRSIERQYNDTYQEERDVLREAEQAERERQRAAEQAARDPRDPEAVRKEIERELARERDDQAARAAGMQAVREHRTAMSKQSESQGVVVNQNISNITAMNAWDAANKLRRKTLAGFENLTGVI